MNTDIQIQKDVMDELKWNPLLDGTEIGVAVKNGIVTLSGQVNSFSKKLAAEECARKIKGVKAIAEDIQLGVSPLAHRTDTEIAEAVVNALKWHSAVQEDKIRIKVEDAQVRLEGEVDWDYQRNNAKTAIEHLAGVKSVLNLIKVKPRITAADVREKINAALQRAATVDASKIMVEVVGDTVKLSGSVRSYAEMSDAENAVWKAPGVTRVDSTLEISQPDYSYEEY